MSKRLLLDRFCWVQRWLRCENLTGLCYRKKEVASDQSVKQSINIKTSEFWALKFSNNSPFGALIWVLTFCLKQLKLQDRLRNYEDITFRSIWTDCSDTLKQKRRVKAQNSNKHPAWPVTQHLPAGQILGVLTGSGRQNETCRGKSPAERRKKNRWEIKIELTGVFVSKVSKVRAGAGTGSGCGNRKCSRLWKPL